MNIKQRGFTQHHFLGAKSGAGFTIIELLVVIAIIGLISSVVLVSMKGSTGKAKIAKGLEFSQTIMNTIGHDAVGVWNFDEGSGGTANDKSGYGNHGTITGATWVSGEENTPHWFVDRGEGKSALKFDGNDYIQIPHSSSLMPQSITIEAWIKFNSTENGSWMIVNKAPGNTSGSYYIFGSSPSAGGLWSIFGPDRARYNIGLGGFTKEKWYHVVGTFDASTGVMKAYVNAKETGSRDGAALGSNTANVLIGRYTSGYYMDGLIDEVRIYERALGSSEIEQHYADGIQKHQIALK